MVTPANPRNINIFLRDGDPDGTREADFAGSTSLAIGFRRNQLTKLESKVEETIKRPGVYILVGGDDGNVKRDAYIGESGDVFGRLKIQNSSPTKQFWEDTIALVSKDSRLTKSHAMYAESRLLSQVENTSRWNFPNVQKPSDEAGRLPEPDRHTMNNFVAEAKILVGVLGCDIFRSYGVNPTHSTTSDEADADQPAVTFSLRGRGYDARMRLSPSGHFIVEAGSKARKDVAPAAGSAIENLRHSMEEGGDLHSDDSSLGFTSDFEFSSVSAAAGVVCGFKVSGRTAWKNEEGKTYGEWEAAQSDSLSEVDSSR